MIKQELQSILHINVGAKFCQVKRMCRRKKGDIYDLILVFFLSIVSLTVSWE